MAGVRPGALPNLLFIFTTAARGNDQKLWLKGQALELDDLGVNLASWPLSCVALRKVGVFVSRGHCKTFLQTWWLQTIEIDYLAVLAGSLKSRGFCRL